MSVWKDEYADILRKEVYNKYVGRSVYLLKYFAMLPIIRRGIKRHVCSARKLCVVDNT